MDGLIDSLEEAAPTAEPLLSELLKGAAREITDLRNALKTMEGLVADLRRELLQLHPPLWERRSKRRQKLAAPADA
jgi:hypothetical protein